MWHCKHIIKCQLNPKCGKPSHTPHHNRCPLLLMLFIKCSRSVYRNPINTEVSAVVMLHHMALLADHANGRIRREKVFRDHNDLLVGYIKICTFMSDESTSFLILGLCAPCYWQSSLLQQHVAAHSAFCCWRSHPWPPNKTTFRASISPTSVSTSTSMKFAFLLFSVLLPSFRQDIILASESVLYADRIHEVICIDVSCTGRVQGGTWSWFSCTHL